MHSPGAVDQVAIECLLYVFSNITEDIKYNTLALTLGKRAEYVLWLTHPAWGRSKHLAGLRLASNNDLGMGKILNRLKDAGFKKAASYRKLATAERAALGAFFIECIAESTKMIEIYVFKQPKRMTRKVRATDHYWKFQSQWKQSLILYSTVKMPMITMPRPWTRFDDGGYLTKEGHISTVAWERWPELSKQMLPCVMGSINLLQSIPHTLDHDQMEFEMALWRSGHAMGKLPSQTRLPTPIDKEYKERGLGPRAYWEAVWKWKADRRRNSSRQGFIHGAIAYERIKEATSIHYVWFMDHRGRLYAKGGQLNPQSADHHRSLIQFQRQSPVKGNEAQFAWSLGEAYGLQSDWAVRQNYLTTMSHIISRCGSDPLSHLSYIGAAKEPFRFVQLCRDWHGYIKDPGYTSGTIHWMDQTCSGWGHVACLIGDGVLAKFTNVTGHNRADLYAGVGKLIESRIKWYVENSEQPEREAKCLEWWAKHKAPRSLWKAVLMPVIYGQSYMTMERKVSLYLRDEIEDFLSEEGLRVLDLASTLTKVAWEVVKQALPHAMLLSQWLAKVAKVQMDKGQRPYWFTANGMAVESFATEGVGDKVTLQLGGRRLFIQTTDASPTLNREATVRKLVPDFIHCQDAAFLQRFVHHWGAYDYPIAVVHDCFGTTLGQAAMLRRELGDQWARFYSVDHLERHRLMVGKATGSAVPEAPKLGTLDRKEIGENPFLFC
jgi:DNA-directed RNA polymerase